VSVTAFEPLPPPSASIVQNFPLRKVSTAAARRLKCVAFLRRVERHERMLRDPDGERMGPLSMAAVDRSTIVVEGDENDAGGGGSGLRSNSVTPAPGAAANAGGGKEGDSTTAAAAVAAGAAAAVPVTATAAEAAAAKAAALALTNMPDEDLVYGIGMDAGCGRPGGFGATKTVVKNLTGETILDGDKSLGGEIRARGLMYHPFELYTTQRRITQAVLTAREARVIQALFNAKVVAALYSKGGDMDKIAAFRDREVGWSNIHM